MSNLGWLAGESSEDAPYSIQCKASIELRTNRTDQFKSGFPTARNLDRMDTILSRSSVVEPEERLVRLNASFTVLLSNLEGESQNVLCTELNWGGFCRERNTKMRT